mmetsp:Transcript_42182/g.89730  ORF Transcript_42182/g.89730 Transcript_42182/m.89730 type:complete len:191 (+) Transcript_42182:1314-1886(+)
MIPPSKHYATYAEMRFSKCIESLCKDVEGTFGIMKGRFRILKTGIPLHGIDVCDRVWLTCCALHNFLLQEYGLDKRWGASHYLFEEGEHNEEDTGRFLHASRGNSFDLSGMGVDSDFSGENTTIPELLWEEDVGEVSGREDGGAIPVHKLHQYWRGTWLIIFISFTRTFPELPRIWITRHTKKNVTTLSQ